MRPATQTIPVASAVRRALDVDVDTIVVLEAWLSRELEAHRARVEHSTHTRSGHPGRVYDAAREARVLATGREALARPLGHLKRIGFEVPGDAADRALGEVGGGRVGSLAAARELLAACASATYQKRGGAAWIERGTRPRPGSRVKPPKIVVVAAG